MKSLFALRRALTAAGLVLISLLAVPSAFATHLRGGSLSWQVISTNSANGTYTVQFTLTESQRWSFPANPGTCTGPITGSTEQCVPVGTAVTLQGLIGTGDVIFLYGDGATTEGSDIKGTVTSVNQAQDYATAIFVFTHTYKTSSGAITATMEGTARLSTLKLGHDDEEYISTIVQNYPNPSPVVSVPAILSVPLQNTATFNLASAVSDIDPNVTLVYRLATPTEMFGIGSLNCPNNTSITYTQGGLYSGNPPGFTVSSAGLVTWDETQISTAVTNSNCKFGTPKAGDLWTAQVMIEAHNSTTNALITKVPVDLLLEFVSPVGDLPTVTINPSGTQTVNIGSTVSFTAKGNSANSGATVTLNASGVPAGATVTGLNATVTPPATSTFTWTPTGLQAGSYVVTYTVTDDNLQQAQASKTIVVATLPTISCSTGASPMYGSAGSVLASVYDPSNELLNVVWSVDGVTVRTDTGLTAYPTAYADTLTQNFGPAGPHSVVATATDPHGVAVSCTVPVTVTPAPQVVAFNPAPSTPDFAGDSVVLSATGGASGNPVVFSVLSGNASLADDGVTLTYTGAGTVVVAADQAASADGNYAAAQEVPATIVVNPAAAAYNGGTVPVAQQSSIQTATLNFPNGGTLGSLSYLTQGAANLDFIGCTDVGTKIPANPKGGTSLPTSFSCGPKTKAQPVIPVCSVGTTYSAGQICTVSYIFQPTHPGQRLGAVTALDNNGNTMGTSYVSGLGTGPQIVFPGNTTTNALGGGYNQPFGVAVDVAGDVFVADTFNGAIKEIVAGGSSTPVQLVSGLTGPIGIALDGAGNVFFSDADANVVKEIVAVGGSIPASPTVLTLSNTFSNPHGIAVDGAGNVYVADYYNNAVKEILAVGGTIPANPTIVTLATGFKSPSAVAVDRAGNVYVADTGNNAVQLIAAVGGGIPANSTPTVLANGFNGPAGVAVDGAGDLFIADTSNGVVREIVAVGGSVPSLGSPSLDLSLGSGFSNPQGLAVDGAGNVYVADSAVGAVYQIPLSTPPSVTFADTNVGSASSSNPQNVTVANNGYDPSSSNPLTFSGVATGTTSFVLDAANACSSSTSLEPGQTCSLALDFTPQTPGSPLTDAVTLTDNNLNNLLSTSSPQLVALSGNGLQQVPTVTVAPATITYGTATVSLSATVAFAGTTAPTGAVTFTIDSGTAVPATCTGTTSPLSCTASYASNTLGVPTHGITASIAASPGFLTASGTNTLTVTPAGLGVTIIGNPAKVYDGTTNATLTPANYQITGLMGTDQIAISQTVGTYLSANVGPEPMKAQFFNDQFTAISGSLSNYILPSFANGTGTITPAGLGITIIGNPTKVYDGTLNATLTPANYRITGLVGTDQIAISQTVGTYLSANVGPEPMTAQIFSDQFTAASGSLSNYILPPYANGTGTITPASLTVTAGSYNGTYDGNTHPLSPCVASANPDGLTCSNSPAGPVGPDVGGSAVTPVASGSTSNYNVTVVNGAWSITPLTVRLTAGSYTGVYDGNSHAPTPCTTSYAGLSCTNSPVSVGPGVASGFINAVASTPTTGIAADYTIVAGQPGLLSITPRPASITPNASGKVYGAAEPTLTGTTSGFLPADGIVVAYSRTAGQTVAGSPYTISATVTPNPALANYTVTSNTAPFTITQLAASVTPNAASKVFGTADPTFTGTLTGFLPADGITASYSRTAGETVAGSPYTISATLSPTAALANYTITSNTAAFTITKATPTLNWAAPAGISYGTALSATQLNATASPSGGTFSYNPTAGTVPTVGSQTLSVLYTPSDTADYTTASTSVPLAVSQAMPVVTWQTPASITYGTPTGAAQKTATATGVGGVNLPGSYYYTTPDGMIFGVGTHPLGVAFTPTDTKDYSSVSAYTTVTVTKATPTVNWLAPAAITYGTALSATQLNATASVPGGFSYNPAAGTVLHAGMQTLSVTFTPTDSTDYNPVTTTVSLTVNKVTPTITWASPAAINYGTPLSATQLNAKASVAGTFAYNPAAGTILSGGTQNLSVTFTPTDSTDYNSVTAGTTIIVKASTVTLGVAGGTQTYPTWTNFVLGPTWSGSRPPTGTVTLYNNGVAIVTLPLGGDGKAYYTTQPPLNVGVNNLTASYSGDSVYPAGMSGVTTITVLPAPVNFQATCEGALVYGQTYQCQVNLSAGTPTPPVGNITYSYDGGAPVAVAINALGNAPFTVPGIPSAGTHTLAISYAGQGNYAAAGTLQRGFTTQPGQTQLFISPSTYFTAHGSTITLSGVASTLQSGTPVGTVTVYDNGTALGHVSVGSNGQVSFAIPDVAKGQHTYSAKFEGTSNYASATSASVTITAY
jgi:hypothetical protein